MFAFVRVVAALSIAIAATDAFAARVAEPEPVQASVEFGAGYEQYRNAVVFFDEFDEVRAAPGSVTRSSAFYTAAAGLDFDLPLLVGGSWTLNFDVEGRRTPQLPQLHRNRWKVATGFVVPTGSGELELRLTADELQVFNSGFRRKARGAQVRRIDRGDRDRTVWALHVQRFRHDAFDDLFDGDQALASVVHRHDFPGAWQPSLAGRIAAGVDRNRWHFDDLSSRDAVFELEAAIVPTPPWRLSAAGSRQFTRYGGPAPGLDFTRRDQRHTARLALQHGADKGRITRIELEAIERESNDPVSVAAVRRGSLSVEWVF
jgi:hypothetical protein